MSQITVNRVSIAYEVAGEGSPIVWTSGTWQPRDPYTYVFAGQLSAGYKVLTWDRRNTGASDLAIEDAESEWHLWTDDLHALLQELGMSPAYVGGGSAGSVLSLLMAHRYPRDVKGLILYITTNDDVQGILLPLAGAHYLCLAAAAESEGMEAAIKLSADPPEPDWAEFTIWIADAIARKPETRDRLLSMDPEQFARTMRMWAKWLASPRLYLANLSDEELAGIDVPALVAHGFDPWHPEHTARSLARLLPNAEWVDFESRYTRGEIQAIVDVYAEGDVGASTELAFRFPFCKDFLRRVESGQFGTGKRTSSPGN